MTHELVLIVAQTFDVDHGVVVGNDDRVFQRRTERKAGGPEALDVTHEAEGAGARKLVLEGGGGQVPCPLLAADQRAVEVDLHLEAGAVIGQELRPGGARFDAHRLGHADIAALDAEIDDADLLDRIDEDFRTAVHDRHFRAVDLKHEIVEAERVDRGHHMLDRGDRAGRRKAEHGAKIGIADLGGNRLELDRAAILEGAHEHDPRTGLGRLHAEGDLAPGMDADTGQAEGSGDGGLEAQQCDCHKFCL